MTHEVIARSADVRGGPVGWYVSRVVRSPDRQLEVLRGVLTADGTTLRLDGRVEPSSALAPTASYPATLRFAGLVPTRLKVEMIVIRRANGLAEIGIRPAARVPLRRVGAERYFDAAWAVLDALGGNESAATTRASSQRPAGRQVAGVRGNRKAVRAS